MLFNSLSFLIFFALFVPAYYATHGRVRLVIALVASNLFYAWWDWRFLGLLWFSTLFEYVVALRLHAMLDGPRRRRLLVLSMTTNLGLLGFFKYFNFFAATAHDALAALGVHAPQLALNVVLPVGISFYTFQTMSYAIDVYRRQVEPERDLLRFATSVALFVHLVAGPIVRARHLLPQLQDDRQPDIETATRGFEQVLRGYFKKVVVADSLAPIVDAYFVDPSLHDGASLLIAIYFYAFQIYCDFSGYTDIALGCARLLGYDLGVNFDRPYFSRTFSEFWTRWHISLSSWLRDYLYIPLGGNRGGAVKTYRNLALTMLLGGLWHGASWTFVAWGGLHGAYLVVERLVERPLARLAAALRLPPSVRSFLAVVLVFHLTTFAWIFFRAPSFATAWAVIAGIATRTTLSLAQVQSKFPIAKGVGLCVVLMAAELLSFRPAFGERFRTSPALRYASAAGIVWSLALLGAFSGNNFIYFQF